MNIEYTKEASELFKIGVEPGVNSSIFIGRPNITFTTTLPGTMGERISGTGQVSDEQAKRTCSEMYTNFIYQMAALVKPYAEQEPNMLGWVIPNHEQYKAYMVHGPASLGHTHTVAKLQSDNKTLREELTEANARIKELTAPTEVPGPPVETEEDEFEVELPIPAEPPEEF